VSGRPQHRDHPRGWRVDPAPDGRGTPPLRSDGRLTMIGIVLFVLSVDV
jgi:hypothetical protein